MQGMPIPHLQRVGPITLPSSRLNRLHGLSLVTQPPNPKPQSSDLPEGCADQRSSCRLTASPPTIVAAHRPFKPTRTGFDANGRLPSSSEPITRHSRRALRDIPLTHPLNQQQGRVCMYASTIISWDPPLSDTCCLLRETWSGPTNRRAQQSKLSLSHVATLSPQK